MNTTKLVAAALVVFAAACGTSSDESMYLTGSETEALTTPLADGGTAVSCPSPKKVLICHIPPGNPANAHSICVGAPAVDPHQRLHGDSIGACGPTTGGDTDAGTPPPPPPPADAGSACVQLGGACSASSPCCDPNACMEGVCGTVL